MDYINIFYDSTFTISWVLLSFVFFTYHNVIFLFIFLVFGIRDGITYIFLTYIPNLTNHLNLKNNKSNSNWNLESIMIFHPLNHSTNYITNHLQEDLIN